MGQAKGQVVRIGLTLAAVAAIGSIGLTAPWIVMTDGPPSNLVVQNNEAAPAECVIAFSKGEAWRFSVDANETRRKFFLSGVPELSSIECRSGAVSLAVHHGDSICGGGPNRIAIMGPGEFVVTC